MRLVIYTLLLALPIAYLIWRHRRNASAGSNHRQYQRATNEMSREEALKVLDLDGSASRQDIVQAHRRLMSKVHPDHGGSTYMAQQLNEAKRVLLAR